MTVVNTLTEAKKTGKKLLAILIDPDNSEDKIKEILAHCQHAGADFIFVGGSLLYKGNVSQTLSQIKDIAKLPVILFPGSEMQVAKGADALLFISLISGRNPELLIGKHVAIAPFLSELNMEIIPTGYLLIDGGKQTTASYISQTMPIPADKPGIAMATALAGCYLGHKAIYMDAGSGAEKPISSLMLQTVAKAISVPLIVGGGIKTKQQAWEAWNAGADLVVVGNVLEENGTAIQNWKT
jgi:putative glycerol-1-phosphate prenyltransferase